MKFSKFFGLAIITAFETYFFNVAVMRDDYLLAFLMAILIIRNVQIAFLVGKINQVIDKLGQRKEKD